VRSNHLRTLSDGYFSGFHTSPCGYCTSNIRQNKKKIQSNDSPDGKNVASEQIESSQSPTSDAPVESRASFIYPYLPKHTAPFEVVAHFIGIPKTWSRVHMSIVIRSTIS
jgi:hypothetical protein